MEERVRELFKDGLKCNEEVEQIKNIFGELAEKRILNWEEFSFE